MRRKLRNVLTLLLVLVLMSSMLALPACGGDDDDEDDNGATTTTTNGDSNASYTLKLAHAATASSMQGQDAEKFAELVDKYTDGQVEVEIYPNGMLYSFNDQVQAGQSGAIDVLWASTYAFSSYIQYLMFGYLYGFWDSVDHCIAFNTHPDVVARISADLGKTGLHFLGMPLVGTESVWFSSENELKSMKDADGRRMGTRAGTPKSNVSEWSGIEGVEVDATELLTAWQTGMYELYSTSSTVAVSQAIWEMGAKHGLGMPHSVNMGFVLAMNSKAWDKLPADIQDIITNQVMPEFMDSCHEILMTSEAEAGEILESHMETWNVVTDEEYEQMFAATTDNTMTKMFQKMAGDLYDLADSLR